MQQLTKDDVKSGGNTFEDLTQDSPLSNCINADGDFELNHIRRNVKLPIILLVATDGCYGYVQTPAHFEHLLLRTLQSANNPDEWQKGLASALSEIAGDDVSLALISMGWEGFAHLKQSFLRRSKKIQTDIQPIDEVVNTLNKLDKEIESLKTKRENFVARKKELCLELWCKYRRTYERRLRDLR